MEPDAREAHELHVSLYGITQGHTLVKSSVGRLFPLQLTVAHIFTPISIGCQGIICSARICMLSPQLYHHACFGRRSRGLQPWLRWTIRLSGRLWNCGKTLETCGLWCLNWTQTRRSRKRGWSPWKVERIHHSDLFSNWRVHLIFNQGVRLWLIFG